MIVETAVQAGLPGQPSEPQPALLIALGVTGGFAAAVILVLGLGYRSRRKQVNAATSDALDPTPIDPVAGDPVAAEQAADERIASDHVADEPVDAADEPADASAGEPSQPR